MPERTLPTGYTRIEKNLIGQVADSITVNPRSRGLLFLPGQYSVSDRPPAHEVKLISTAVDNQAVHYEEIQRGTPERYTLSYDVTNHRDSPAFADLVWSDQPPTKRD